MDIDRCIADPPASYQENRIDLPCARGAQPNVHVRVRAQRSLASGVVSRKLGRSWRKVTKARLSEEVYIPTLMGFA